MGRGLSELQKNILTVLEEHPKVSRFTGGPLYARPRDIIEALGMANTATSRVSVSKALRRLADRGLVQVYVAQVALQGKGYRYGLTPHSP